MLGVWLDVAVMEEEGEVREGGVEGDSFRVDKLDFFRLRLHVEIEREGKREGGKEGGREGGRERGREGEREGWREGGKKCRKVERREGDGI